MHPTNLTIENKKFVYRSGDFSVTWNCGKTGPGKAKVTGFVEAVNINWAQGVIDRYIKHWPNDRVSGLYEFCRYANDRGFVQALNFLE